MFLADLPNKLIQPLVSRFSLNGFTGGCFVGLQTGEQGNHLNIQGRAEKPRWQEQIRTLTQIINMGGFDL